MNLNISQFNFGFPKAMKSNSVKNFSTPSFRANDSKNDTFEMSVGYVNDTHGQTNNMMRILSGIKGDLRLSAGDNDIGDEKNKTIHRATAKFLNLAGVAATAFGNHDLDTTQVDFVDTKNNDLNSKVLATNFKKVDNWENLEDNLENYGRTDINKALDPSEIVEVKGEKIGLIGASPIDMFERATHPAYHTDCYVQPLDETIDNIQNEVNGLKEKGINKIFLLSHLGHERDKSVAQNVDGIDVIIGGHTHELLRDIKEGENLFYSKSGEPIIMTEAGRDGSYFGLLNLTFDKDGVITKAQNNIGETRLFGKNMINQYVFDEILGKPEKIGYIRQAPPPPETLIEENPHANFVCDAMKYMTNSDIAVWNNSGIRNFFHQGAIDSRDIKDIAPFFDRISVANVSEKAIVDMFKDNIATTYASQGYKPGLIAVSGLTYGVNETDHTLTFMKYIDKQGVEHNIDINNPSPDKTYKLVTDEFIMSHGADFPVLSKAEDCLEIYPYDKDVMTCQYIKELAKPIDINQTGRIVFES
jgi:2',3'-cyclic-nucleotide 2'-phosphodiesterase (5'-nucleotidase family)